VIRHWKEKAGDRQTVVFCSTVAHAATSPTPSVEAGVPAALIHGDMGGRAQGIARRLCRRRVRVVVNVAVLTEGWDHPPTSCVVLLRPSSYKSTMIQMVGRGLRTVDPAEHPGVVKTDCIVLDFGTSSLTHGTLEQDVDLDGHDPSGEAPTKTCPACERGRSRLASRSNARSAASCWSPRMSAQGRGGRDRPPSREASSCPRSTC
jgi:DNA repair protein RadD